MSHSKVALSLVGLVVGLSLASEAASAPTLWVVDAGQKLGKIDVATGAVSGVVNTGITFTDIAFDPSGTLWGISFFQLFTVNPTTGASALVGDLNAGQSLNSLVFGADGTLWAAGSGLFKLNQTTGAATLIGNTGNQSAGDLAFVNGDLLLSTTANTLVRLNTVTGTGTTIGSFGTANVYGLATPDNNTLYGLSGTQVFSVNPISAVGSGFVSYAGHGLGVAYGSTFVSEAIPVPELDSYALLLAGLGIVGMAVRRQTQRDA